MIGTTLAELRDKLLHGHEAEFIYKAVEYSIEAELSDKEKFVKIWMCSTNEPRCIAEKFIVKTEDIDELLTVKCFDGKSFIEIEAEVTVENIF